MQQANKLLFYRKIVQQTSTTVRLALLFSALGEAEPMVVPVLSGSLISKGAFVPVFLTGF